MLKLYLAFPQLVRNYINQYHKLKYREIKYPPFALQRTDLLQGFPAGGDEAKREEPTYNSN